MPPPMILPIVLVVYLLSWLVSRVFGLNKEGRLHCELLIAVAALIIGVLVWWLTPYLWDFLLTIDPNDTHI